MKTAVKWILGILLALIVIAGIAAAAYVVFGGWGGMMGSRALAPWRSMPWRSMPMRPFGGHMGVFFPLRLVFLGLVCLGVPLLLLLGGGALLLNRSGKQVETTPPAPVSASPAPVETGQVCPNCGKAVQADWSHCPYCGQVL